MTFKKSMATAAILNAIGGVTTPIEAAAIALAKRTTGTQAVTRAADNETSV